MSTNRPTTWDPDKQASLFEGSDPAMMQTFWQAMHSLSIFTARVLGEAVDFKTFRKLLDGVEVQQHSTLSFACVIPIFPPPCTTCRL